MSRAESLLAALVLRGRRVVVVGASAEAAERAAALLETGADVVVFAASPSPELARLAAGGEISLLGRGISEADVSAARLLVVVERDAELVARLGPLADRHKTLFLAVDQPAHNSLNHAALVRAGSVSVAISTDGSVPALAKRLREELARVFDAAGVAEWAGRLAELRKRTPTAERSAVLGRVLAELRLGPLELPDWDDDETP